MHTSRIEVHQFWKLILADHTFPYLFSTDDTTWYWSPDKSRLTITQTLDPESFTSHVEVITVESSKIKSFAPSDN